MRTFDLTPPGCSAIGFDHLTALVDASLRQATDDNDPPYSICRSSDDHQQQAGRAGVRPRGRRRVKEDEQWDFAI
jgi:hypothetical protein